jgi:hypothetical protein
MNDLSSLHVPRSRPRETITPPLSCGNHLLRAIDFLGALFQSSSNV